MKPTTAAATLAFYFYSLPWIYVLALSVFIFTAPYYPLLGLLKIIEMIWEASDLENGPTDCGDDGLYPRY